MVQGLMSNYRQQQEQDEITEQIAEIEAAALVRPLTIDEVSLIQWATGVQRKEMSNAKYQ